MPDLAQVLRGLPRRFFIGIFILGFSNFIRAADSGEGSFLTRLSSKDVNVITVTDFTDAGKKLPLVSKENPAYFEALILGYNDWGRSIAGEKIPDKKLMIRVIFKVLADQGYYPCTNLHKPTLVLALAWGSMNQATSKSLLFMGGDKMDLLWELNPYEAGSLNPRALTRGMRSGVADMIMESSQGNLYVASIQAFDEAEAMNYKTVLLWHTKISCPADGLEMDTALRQMIHVAGPNIGRETLQPVVTTAPERNGSVEIGELKVLETLDTSNLPITDRAPEPAEKAKKSK